MQTFLVTYPSGQTEVEAVSDCETVEEYANRKFGSVDWEAFGTTISVVGEIAEEEELVHPLVARLAEPPTVPLKTETKPVEKEKND